MERIPLNVFLSKALITSSVWRPLYRPIEACPLAYCDARTISEDDVLAADRVSPDYVFDLYYAKYSPRQKWYWLSDQTPDEMTVFVQFDSSAAGKPEVVQGKSASYSGALGLN
jgi:hypothetical protein